MYYVVTPEFVMYRGSDVEPDEWGCDMVEVPDAKTKREALIKALPMLRNLKREYGSRRYMDDVEGNPFTGLRAEWYDDEPENDDT